MYTPHFQMEPREGSCYLSQGQWCSRTTDLAKCVLGTCVGAGPAVLLVSLCEALFQVSRSFMRKHPCSVVTYIIQGEDLQVINTNLCFGDALFILMHSVFLRLPSACCSCFLPSCWFSIIKALKQTQITGHGSNNFLSP